MKRYLSVVLSLALLLSLSACTGDAAAPAQSTAPASGASPADPTETVLPTLSWQNTEPPAEKVWTQEVHSGIREDGTFNEGTLFIGDSLTYGLVNEYLARYGLIGDARYMAVVGAPLSRFFSYAGLEGEGALYSPEFYNLAYFQAVARVGEQATAIYLMLGTNYEYSATSEKYIEVVDYLLETCPNATVHLQLVPYSSKPLVDYEAINGYITETYEYYQEQGIERVMLIDTFSIIGTAQIYDGVHLNDEGKDAWYMALLANAKNNNIPE